MTARGPLALAACVAVGIVLYCLVFAAVFSGLWSLVSATALLYVAGGAVGAAVGRINARPVAAALIAPAIPGSLWLFAASLAEAGLARASLWPLAVVVLAGLAWVGATLAARRRRTASATTTPTDLRPAPPGDGE